MQQSKLRTRRSLIHRTASVLIVTLFFIFGYNAVVANTQSCGAQYSVSPPVPMSPLPKSVPFTCGCAPGNQKPCTIPASTAPLAAGVDLAYYNALVASSVAVENYIGMAVDTLVQTVFSRLEQVEQDLADWFETYWHYNYRPSLQDAAEQANVAGMEQSMQLAATTDAEMQQRASLEIQEQTARAEIARTDAANTETCAVASAAGGLGSANAFSRGMRRAWQGEATGSALNRAGARGNSGVASMIESHAEEFEALFCNPNDNGGRNNCGSSDPAFYNADTQVTSRLFNALTIPVDRDIRHNTAVQHMIDNMVGRPRAEPLPESVVGTAGGQESWIERRSYVARKNAARAIPELLASWRVPGGAGSGGAGCRSEGSAGDTSSSGADAGGASSATEATAEVTASTGGSAAPPSNQPAAGSMGTVILAMGTNGGRSHTVDGVQSDTLQMIRRLQGAGHRVIVVLPVNARVPVDPRAPARYRRCGNLNCHDFPAYHRAVRAAAQEAGIPAGDVIYPSGFNPGSDGYHISPDAAAEIARRFPGAPRYGDSNSQGINTGGPSNGARGHTTHQIVRSQQPNGTRGGDATAPSAPPPTPAAVIEPGSCSFVAAMREGAGVPLEGLSENPSYREIIHAMAIDRINSGAYAIDKIGSAERQQMEKLVLNAIYLMQLRDYYELLERTALTLSVQVAVMADQYPLPRVSGGGNRGGR